METCFRRVMIVAVFVCGTLGFSASAVAQTMEVSAYMDTWTDVDAGEQVVYAEIFDTSHYSWASVESTFTSATDADEGGGGACIG